MPNLENDFRKLTTDARQMAEENARLRKVNSQMISALEYVLPLLQQGLPATVDFDWTKEAVAKVQDALAEAERDWSKQPSQGSFSWFWYTCAESGWAVDRLIRGQSRAEWASKSHADAQGALVKRKLELKRLGARMRSAEVTDIALAVFAVVLISALLLAFVSLH
jgi:hypothetical protein